MNNNKPFLFAIIAFFIAFGACNNPTECTESNESIEPPKLEVVNDLQECFYASQSKPRINSVLLVGYEFKNITIEIDESMTFTLDDGFPAGLENVEITVQGIYGIQGFGEKIDVDFIEGKTTRIRLVKDDFCTYSGLKLVNG